MKNNDQDFFLNETKDVPEKKSNRYFNVTASINNSGANQDSYPERNVKSPSFEDPSLKPKTIFSLFTGKEGAIFIPMLIIMGILCVLHHGFSPMWLGIYTIALNAAIIPKKEQDQRTANYFGIAVGVVLIASTIAGIIKGSIPEEPEFGIIICFCSLFIYIGGYVGIIIPVERSHRKKRCTQTVSAVTVNFEKHYHTDDEGRTTVTYAPIFDFEYQNVPYHVVSPGSAGKAPVIGTFQKLFINPLNPMEVYDPILEKDSDFVSFLFGSMFMVAGLIAIFAVINTSV